MAPRKKSSFKSHQSPQPTSPLFNKLPAELRLLVIKGLLADTVPIRFGPGEATSMRRGKPLCLSVLRTCQRLYHEGLEIFRRNMIRLRFQTCVSEKASVLLRLPPRTFDLVTVSEFARTKEGKHILTNFPNLRLELVRWELEGIPELFRSLRPYLRGKSVQISLRNYLAGFNERHPGVMGLLELIRCKSLTLLRPDGGLVDRKVYADMAAMVESDKPIIDLPIRGDKLVAHLNRSRRSAGLTPMLNDRMRDPVDHFEKAAREFRAEDFLRHQQTLLRRIREYDGLAIKKHMELEDELRGLQETHTSEDSAGATSK